MRRVAGRTLAVLSVIGSMTLALAPSAAAGPLSYDSGPAVDPMFAIRGEFLLADDFSFGADMRLTGGTIVTGGAYQEGTWLLLRDSGFGPQDLMATGPVSASGEFTILNVPIRAGARYWLGYYGGALDDQCSAGTTWRAAPADVTERPLVLSLPFGPIDAACRDGLPVGSWDFSNGFWDRSDLGDDIGNFAFEVHGRVVPEPSAITLLGLGVLALLRRRP